MFTKEDNGLVSTKDNNNILNHIDGHHGNTKEELVTRECVEWVQTIPGKFKIQTVVPGGDNRQ